MEKTKVINMAKTKDKWLSLLLYLNNSVPHIFKIECDNKGIANKYYHRMVSAIKEHPTWFNLAVSVQGSDLYVIKTSFAQKVVIRDE